MTYAVRAADELYVYWNGRLVYKRWLRRGYGKVFDPYGPPWSPRHDTPRKEPEDADGRRTA